METRRGFSKPCGKVALPSRRAGYRTEQHIRGRIGFSLLAVSQYGFRACDIADLLCKGRNWGTQWLNRSLCDECDDPAFSERFNRLDTEFSSR